MFGFTSKLVVDYYSYIEFGVNKSIVVLNFGGFFLLEGKYFYSI